MRFLLSKISCFTILGNEQEEDEELEIDEDDEEEVESDIEQLSEVVSGILVTQHDRKDENTF